MSSLPEFAPQRDIYTVSRLNQEARDLLAAHFPLIWLEGEISNLSRPASGHLYFSLKDARSQVRCALFRGRGRHLGVTPENGMQVLVRATVSLYEARGDYQLIIEHLEPAGEGALRLAFEALKNKLAAEGLFDEARKRPLPTLPRRIGVITSPSGAAIRDILSVLARRFPAIPVLIYPVPVQGEGAADKIAAAIHNADQRRDCDVLILGRGGGSLEDLWSFNEESVARALAACSIPVVAGVGHEIDVSIADFVADRRAPTPSVAAEMVTPDRQEWLQWLSNRERRLLAGLQHRLQQLAQRCDWLARRLEQRHPRRQIQLHQQRLSELHQRLRRSLEGGLRHRRVACEAVTARLYRHHPGQRLQLGLDRCRSLGQRLNRAQRVFLDRQRQRLAALGHTLDTVSPLATLGRGYAIVQDASDGAVLRRARDCQTGQTVRARLAEGELLCRVDQIIEGDSDA